jgi:MFS family permease
MNRIKHYQLGLRENAGLFSVLVLMSAFVGAMVGFERSLLPELTRSWGISEFEAALLMVAVFGLSKAVANLYTGKLIAESGRKRALILGWILAMLVPLLLSNSSGSATILFANIALGLSQGITWSTTVIMKIDIVGTAKRGTAMGLNESAGYLAVGLASALAAAHVEQTGEVRTILYVAECVVGIALVLSILVLPDTKPWVELEVMEQGGADKSDANGIFYRTTFGDRELRRITWAGVANNANDGVLWAVLPSALLAQGVSLSHIGLLTGVHAAVWGIGQLFTGPLSNSGKTSNLIFLGLILQAASLLFLPFFPTQWLLFAFLGAGTAMVYPTFLVGISNHSHPSWRPRALSTYRFWRDMGYVFGALLGYLALQTKTDALQAFTFIGIVTAAAALPFKKH